MKPLWLRTLWRMRQCGDGLVRGAPRNGQSDEAMELIHSHVDSEETRHGDACHGQVCLGCLQHLREIEAHGRQFEHGDFQHTLLEAWTKCNPMRHTSSLMDEMKRAAVELDPINHSTLERGQCCEGDFDRDFRVMEEMKTLENFASDEIMYNSILTVVGRSSSWMRVCLVCGYEMNSTFAVSRANCGQPGNFPSKWMASQSLRYVDVDHYELVDFGEQGSPAWSTRAEVFRDQMRWAHSSRRWEN